MRSCLINICGSAIPLWTSLIIHVYRFSNSSLHLGNYLSNDFYNSVDLFSNKFSQNKLLECTNSTSINIKIITINNY